MILEALINLWYRIFTSVFDGVSVAQIPSETLTNVNNSFDDIIDTGATLIDFILPYNLAIILLGIVITIEVISAIYTLIMWILKKIPVASIQ